MKTILLIITLCFLAASAFAQDATSSLVDKYQADSIPSDFSKRFDTDEAKTDFRKLRNYLNEKEAILVDLKSASALLQRNKLAMLPGIRDIQARLFALTTEKTANDSLQVNINTITNSQQLGWWPFDEYQNAKREIVTLSTGQINEKLHVVERYLKDAEPDIKKARLADKNISVIEQDINDCRRQIDIALAPEYKQQEFRTQISLYFSVLIALVLVCFFFIVYKNAANDLSKVLLSENGLQFVTVFVLIIAVILFGILNILHSSELAAILAGISGYILGRGTQQAGTKAKVVPPSPQGTGASAGNATPPPANTSLPPTTTP